MSKKSKMLEDSLREDIHPFKARFTPPPATTPEADPSTQAVNTASGIAVSSTTSELEKTSGVAGMGESGITDNTTSGIAVNTAKGLKPGSALASKAVPNSQLAKWTLYIKPKTQKAVKRLALEEDANYYDVVQQALDEYLERRGVKQ